MCEWFLINCISYWRKLRRILSSGRAKTVSYSDRISLEAYHRAGLLMASSSTVLWSPSGFNAAEMTTFVSMTSRSGIIGAWTCERL